MYEPHYDPESYAVLFLPGPPEKVDYLDSGRNIFVCGSLQQPKKMAALVGREAAFAPAVALGYRRLWRKVEGRDVSFMEVDPQNPNRPLTGMVYVGLTDEEVAGVETYELEGGVRRRVTIEVFVGDRRVEALTYLNR